jgi:hypothetical protein
MKIIETRLRFANMLAAHPLPDPFGIRCVGVLGDQGEAPLLLVADTDENDGASATNVMFRLLPALVAEWKQFPVTSSIVIEKDSMGCFDMVVPTWHAENSRCEVRFTPLRYPSVPPRSRQAFEVLFGDCGRFALAHLE